MTNEAHLQYSAALKAGQRYRKEPFPAASRPIPPCSTT